MSAPLSRPKEAPVETDTLLRFKQAELDAFEPFAFEERPRTTLERAIDTGAAVLLISGWVWLAWMLCSLPLLEGIQLVPIFAFALYGVNAILGLVLRGTHRTALKAGIRAFLVVSPLLAFSLPWTSPILRIPVQLALAYGAARLLGRRLDFVITKLCGRRFTHDRFVLCSAIMLGPLAILNVSQDPFAATAYVATVEATTGQPVSHVMLRFPRCLRTCTFAVSPDEAETMQVGTRVSVNYHSGLLGLGWTGKIVSLNPKK
jgi:hypothetical protein